MEDLQKASIVFIFCFLLGGLLSLIVLENNALVLNNGFVLMKRYSTVSGHRDLKGYICLLSGPRSFIAIGSTPVI